MNCPGHCHLFSTRKHSYRELPIRFAEFSRLHRNERSGTLTGLSRVRSMAQDDAHIFCEPDQVEAELDAFFALTGEVYRALGLEGAEVASTTWLSSTATKASTPRPSPSTNGRWR